MSDEYNKDSTNNTVNTDIKKIKEKILKDHIKPHSKLFFVAKNILFWTLIVLAIAIILIATFRSMYFMHVAHNMLPKGVPISLRFRIFIKVLPIVWIIMIIAGTLIIHYSIRHTKKSYKIPTLILLGLNIGLIVLIGLMRFVLQSPDILNTTLDKVPNVHMPPPHKLMNKIWHNPLQGRVGGTIKDIQDNFLMIESEVGNKENSHIELWNITISSETKIHPLLQLEIEERIKVLGKTTSPSHFTADMMLPSRRPKKEEIEEYCKNKNYDSIKQCVNNDFKIFQPAHEVMRKKDKRKSKKDDHDSPKRRKQKETDK